MKTKTSLVRDRCPALDRFARRKQLEPPLGEHIDDLLAIAQRGELAGVHVRVMEFAERKLFRRAIELARGNQAEAARWLGVSRMTMKAKLVQFGLYPGTENDAAT